MSRLGLKPSYIKFGNTWLKVEGFLEKIKDWWQGYSIRGSPDFILMQKLKSLKKDTTRWNRDNFGKLEAQKDKLLGDLAILEQSVEGRLVTKNERERSLHLKLKLQEIAKIEEISWRQKSRYLWLKGGDKNTKFFQKIENSHRRINHIDKLLIGEEVCENKNDIKAEILRFYQALYTEEEQWRPEVRFASLKCFTQAEKVLLERNFEEEEV